MADKSTTNENEVSRERLAELLNEDLAREYQAIIGYVVYSQVLTGAHVNSRPATKCPSSLLLLQPRIPAHD